MKNHDSLLTHLRDKTYHDKPSRIAFPGTEGRLHYQYFTAPGGWPGVLNLLKTPQFSRVDCFPDANVLFLDETEGLWQWFRAAALGSTPRATITGPVNTEAAEWLAEPHHHPDRAKAIKAALDNKTWLKKFGIPDDSPILPAVYGYLRLFGLRRFSTQAAPGQLTLVGTDPADKSHTMGMIRKEIGERAQELARKGRKDIEKHGAVSLNDELQCLIAIVHAMQTGRDTLVLTTDEDVLEIFYKAQWMLATHYCSYLAAPLVKADEFGQPAGILEDTEGFFDGPLTLYRRHTQHLQDVLPRIFKQTTVGVIYVAPGHVHQFTFPVETGMLGLFETRAKTGRNTDLFGNQNLHIELGPLKRHLDGLYLGIGHDHGDWRETNGVKTFLPRLDQEFSLNCREHFVRTWSTENEK